MIDHLLKGIIKQFEREDKAKEKKDREREKEKKRKIRNALLSKDIRVISGRPKGNADNRNSEISKTQKKNWEEKRKDEKLMRDHSLKTSIGTSKGMSEYWRQVRKNQAYNRRLLKVFEKNNRVVEYSS